MFPLGRGQHIRIGRNIATEYKSYVQWCTCIIRRYIIVLPYNCSGANHTTHIRVNQAAIWLNTTQIISRCQNCKWPILMCPKRDSVYSFADTYLCNYFQRAAKKQSEWIITKQWKWIIHNTYNTGFGQTGLLDALLRAVQSLLLWI